MRLPAVAVKLAEPREITKLRMHERGQNALFSFSFSQRCESQRTAREVQFRRATEEERNNYTFHLVDDIPSRNRVIYTYNYRTTQ